MGLPKRQRLRKKRLFAEDPHCHWCRQVTIMLDKPPKSGERAPRNLATLDHLDDRNSPARGTYAKAQTPRTVLACWQCNFERGVASEAAIPLEERQHRAKRLPQNTVTANRDAPMMAAMSKQPEPDPRSLDERLEDAQLPYVMRDFAGYGAQGPYDVDLRPGTICEPRKLIAKTARGVR